MITILFSRIGNTLMMMGSMISSFHQHKVFYSVIASLAVYVMNNLVAPNWASDLLGHYKNMLPYVSACRSVGMSFIGDKSISIFSVGSIVPSWISSAFPSVRSDETWESFYDIFISPNKTTASTRAWNLNQFQTRPLGISHV